MTATPYPGFRRNEPSTIGRDIVSAADAAAVRTLISVYDTATIDANFATAAQGALADTAIQPGDNVSDLTNDAGYITGYTVTQADVTAHEAALSITESQITDLGAYLTDAPSDGSEYVRLNGAWAVSSAGGSVAWADVTGKPSTFPPSFHTHNYTEITGFNGAVDARISSQLSNQGILQPYLAPILDNTTTIEWASILGQDLQASVVAGSIGSTQLATAVNNSLALADSAVQPSNFLAQLLANTSNSHTIELADYNGKLEARIENQSVEITKLAPPVVISLGLADTAIQPGDNVSDLTNDAGYITSYTVTQADVTAHEAALTITESQISDLGAYLLDAPSDGSEYVRLNGAWAVSSGGSSFTPVNSSTISWSGSTASVVAGSIGNAQLAFSVTQSLSRADTAMQSGDNVSLLTNDAQYITDAPSDSAYYLRRNATWVNITGSINNANSALQPGDDTLTHWNEAETTSVPNDTVSVSSFTVDGSATNIDAALVPKGTGAVLAAIPDNTVAGGNKRGTNAVDLQTARLNATEVASGDHAIIIGGDRNSASGVHSIVGGLNNNVSSIHGFALSGSSGNVNTGSYCGIVGGLNNTVSANYAVIAGGSGNTASGIYSFIAGRDCIASGDYAVAHGNNNDATALGSAVLSGANTICASNYAVVAGGASNEITAGNAYAGILSGANNDVTSPNGFIGAGQQNLAAGIYGGVAAGLGNSMQGTHGFIGAGWTNTITGGYCFVGGGRSNLAQGAYAIVCGGFDNDSIGNYAFVGGGRDNVASAIFSAVPCGRFNHAIGEYSLAMGYASKAEADNSIALGDRAKSRLLSAHAHAAGRFNRDGDAQFQRVVLRNQSTAAGAVDLYINGSNVELTMEDDSAWHFNIRVVCLSSDGSIGGAWTTEGMIRKDGSAVPVFVGTPTTSNLGKDDAGLDFAVSAQSPDILRLTGTAIAGTYKWVATVELTEVLV